MEQQETQPNAEQAEQQQPADTRQPWQQPKLERLHVSLDTALGGGSASDGTQVATAPFP